MTVHPVTRRVTRPGPYSHAVKTSAQNLLKDIFCDMAHREAGPSEAGDMGCCGIKNLEVPDSLFLRSLTADQEVLEPPGSSSWGVGVSSVERRPQRQFSPLVQLVAKPGSLDTEAPWAQAGTGKVPGRTVAKGTWAQKNGTHHPHIPSSCALLPAGHPVKCQEKAVC